MPKHTWIAVLAGSLCILSVTQKPAPPAAVSSPLASTLEKIRTSALSCSPDWRNYDIGQLAATMIPLPGSGRWHWKISTKSDSAQFYFNQGMNCYYGFHIVESVPSFRKAQQFDPNCAMLYWGEALAMGPNINDFGYTASKEAYAAAQKAVQLSSGAGASEKALITVMASRYSADSTADQLALNQVYAEAMRQLLPRYGSADMVALTADALMLLHPWDFWKHDGTPQAWTPELAALLERGLQRYPNHPGLNHYYIHVVEASPDPGKATASANRLGGLAPSLSHLVHMPSHIYVRTGRYIDGIRANQQAVQGYYSYLAIFPEVESKADLYEFHNRHMETACAINLEDYAAALKLANDCQEHTPAVFMQDPVFGYYVQYIYMSPLFVKIRFQQWEDILSEKPVGDSNRYAALLQHFGRGLAQAGVGNPMAANEELAQCRQLAADSSLEKPLGPMNAPSAGAGVAIDILQGAIAQAERKYPAAKAFYQSAVAKEDNMIYNEPRDWLLPARQWLGACLLESGEFAEAAAVYKEDLRINPNSPVSLNGIKAAGAQKSGSK